MSEGLTDVRIYRFDTQLFMRHEITVVLTVSGKGQSWHLESFVIFSGATENKVAFDKITAIDNHNEEPPELKNELFEIIKSHAGKHIHNYLGSKDLTSIGAGKLTEIGPAKEWRSHLVSLWVRGRNFNDFRTITKETRSAELSELLAQVMKNGRVIFPEK